MPLVVHGLVPAEQVRSDDGGSFAGELDPPIELIDHGQLAAVTSRTDAAELEPSRSNLMTHTKVLEAFGERMTVVPMRFGVLVPDAETLIDAFLAPQHDDALRQLERLRGRVEMRLRGRYHEASVLTEILAQDRRAARLRGRPGMDARMELGQRVAGGIEQRRDRDLARLLERLRPHVEEHASDHVSDPLDAFTVSFLVAKDTLDDFDDAVDQLGQKLAPLIQLELVGPLPPFSFAADGAA